MWETDHLADPGVDWRIILRWIFRKWDVGVSTVLSWGTCECGNEPTGTMKCGGNLYWLKTG